MRPNADLETDLLFGDFRIDRADERLIGPAGPVRLGNKAFQVLLMLAEQDGRLVTKDSLFESVWDGTTVSESALTSAVKELRRALGDGSHAPRYIESVYGRGYRLLEPVRAASRVPRVAAPGRTIRTKALGRRRLLYLGGAAAIAVAGGIALGIVDFGPARRPRSDEPLTVAVMPFDDLSAASSNSNLARGLSREIRNELSRVAGLRVIADSSSFSLAAESADPVSIGRDLGATILVQGTVSLAPGALRISAQLVDAVSGASVWTTTHQDESDNLLRAKDVVTAALIQELSGRIAPDYVVARPPGRRRDPVAFRAVLEAQQLVEESRALRMRGQEPAALDAADRAFAFIQEALAIDRQDIGALLVLATLTRNGWTRNLAAQPLTAIQRATAAVEYIRLALAADPNDPAALAALGDHYRRYEWRWEEAENLLRRALAADANLADAHWSYAYMLGTQGRALEGLRHARILFRLDPETAWRRVALPRLLYVAGDRPQALRHYNRELTAAPDNLFLIRELYFMHLAEGDPAALGRLTAKLAELWRGRSIPEGVASLVRRIEAGVAALAGRTGELIAMVDSDVAAFDAPRTGAAATQQGRASVDLLYVYALEYAWAGRISRALDLLERALGARSLYWPASLPFGRAEFPRAVRTNPRYAALWKSEPRLQQLIAIRLRAVKSGQQAGVLPDGRRVRPRGFPG